MRKYIAPVYWLFPSFVKKNLIVRKIEQGDLKRLIRAFPSEYKRTHADDLRDQENGDLSLYVGWVRGVPAGIALVRWLGPRRDEVIEEFPECPEVYRVFVSRWYRRRGIASALMRACENEAREKGCSQIGLGVGFKNIPAQKLYARFGYHQSSVEKYVDAYEYEDEDGNVVIADGVGTWLVKELEKTD